MYTDPQERGVIESTINELLEANYNILQELDGIKKDIKELEETAPLIISTDDEYIIQNCNKTR